MALSLNGRSSRVWGSQERLAAGSLFDRLIADEEDADVRVSRHPVDAIIVSIQRNLERILNTHAGGAAANPQLGLADFNGGTIHSKEASTHIIASIRHCITAYEPRIGDVDVQYRPGPDYPLKLQFVIVARIVVGNRQELIRVDMAMRDGRFRAAG